MRNYCCWLGLFLTLLSVTPVAAASETPADAAAIGADPTLTPDAIDALVARLSDADVRALLLDELARRHASRDGDATQPATIVTDLSERAQNARTRLVQLARATTDVPRVLAGVWREFEGGRPLAAALLLPLVIGITFGAGWLAERSFRRALRATYTRLLAFGADRALPSIQRVGAILTAFGIQLLGVLVFLIAGITLFLVLWHGHEPGRHLITTLLVAYTVTRAFAAFSWMLLEPRDERLRLFALSDADAATLHRGLVRTAAIAAFGFLGCGLVELLGPDLVVHDLLAMLVGLVVVVSLVRVLYAVQSGLRQSLLVFDSSGPVRRVAAQLVPPATVLVVALLWPLFLVAYALDIAISADVALWTMLLAFFVPHLDATIARLAVVFRLQHPEAGHELRLVGFKLARLFLWLGGALVLSGAYAVDLKAVAAAGVGERLSEALFDITVTIILAYTVWEVARVMIDRRLAAEQGASGAGEVGDEGGAGASRMATLLPLFRMTLQVVIAVMAVLVILSALGVNIGPLLAGAGVVGLAVGFGAQTLVRDIVSGVFFLLDDAFRTGEYIDVGTVKGTVEKISIRSLRLRHHRGYLHTIPFGEIGHLTNYSRDWVIMKLEFRVPFDTDIDLVRRLFKQIGKRLLAHPEIGQDFLEPFKSQGVFTLDDSALVVRGKFTAKPGKQFMARREIYNAVQAAFAENGIRFADRRVTVQVADADRLGPDEQQRVAEAGAAALATPPTAAS